MIYRNSKRVIAPIVISSLLICALLLDAVGAGPLAVWLAFSITAAVSRVLVLGWLLRRPEVGTPRHLTTTAALSLMTGSAYGSVLLFFPDIGAFERAMLTALLISFCSGAVLANAGYRPIFFAFVLPILGSLALLWAVNPGEPIDDALGLFIGATLLLMLIVLAAIAQDTFDAFAISAESSQRQERLVAELATALAETEAARAEAETSSASKTRFLAAASHDLRQPVHVLSLFGAALAAADTDDKTGAIVERMNVAVRSLSAQLNTLLDLSRLDAGDIRPELSTVDLGALAEGLADEFRDMADAQGIALRGELEQALHVRTDPEMLLRILRNLCGNALKYTVEGSVTIGARGVDEVVKLSIADTGIGITESERAHIFDEFYRADNAAHDPDIGLGLGLSIVRRLVDTLGHRIEVSSVAGQGTTVSLYLPRCAPARHRPPRHVDGAPRRAREPLESRRIHRA